jgi:hypothetical protein
MLIFNDFNTNAVPINQNVHLRLFCLWIILLPETRFLAAYQAFLQCAGLLVTIFARLTAEKLSF